MADSLMSAEALLETLRSGHATKKGDSVGRFWEQTSADALALIQARDAQLLAGYEELYRALFGALNADALGEGDLVVSNDPAKRLRIVRAVLAIGGTNGK